MKTLPALYQIADIYLQDLEKLNDLDLPEEVVRDTLESIQGDMQEKCTNVAAFIRNTESLADQIKQAEQAMAARRKTLETRAESIRKYLLDNMQRTGISKIDSPWFKIALAKNPPSVVVDDEDTLKFAHPEFVKVVTTETLDKSGISAALKAGKSVEGAHIQQSERLSIK